MERTLPAPALHHYLLDGLAFPPPVLDTAEVQRYRACCDELERWLGGRPRTVEVRQMHLHFSWAWELASHPRVLDQIENVLGPDVLVWATELFVKHADDPHISIEWHRDRPYMGLEGDDIATAWIALSDSTLEGGCMRVQPGPDRRSSERDEVAAVDVVLRAGEMSIHAPDVWHGSSANRSQQKRVGFVVRYITPDVAGVSDKSPLMLARGSAQRVRISNAPHHTDWLQRIEG
jgi:ectoine hydroxylase-related dioxygenase (phytanoyl-CoA dioxygenase family)